MVVAFIEVLITAGVPGYKESLLTNRNPEIISKIPNLHYTLICLQTGEIEKENVERVNMNNTLCLLSQKTLQFEREREREREIIEG